MIRSRTPHASAHEPDSLDEEAGLSLIELIVVVVIVGLISGVIVMILVNSWNTQQQVNSTTVATNEGQVFASTIERAVRNADDTHLDGDTLIVWTDEGGDRTCQAFAFDPADPVGVDNGDAAYLTAGTGDPDWVTPPWSGPTIVENVSATSGSYFTKVGKEIEYAFEIATDASPVVFDGKVSARNNQPTTEDSPCWP